MKRKGSKIGQLNNKGMSLVEVLIAMVIFALVTVPVLNILVSTARYNAKARERQHMTLSAESIMESFKAYDIEELCRQFQTSGFTGCILYPGGVDGGGAVIPAGTMAVTGKDATGADTDVLFTPSGAFIGSSDDTYQFRINSLLNENDRYDAVISVEPYTALGISQVMTLDDMNLYKDAVWRSGTAHDATAEGQVMNDFMLTAVPEIVAWLNTEDQIKNDYTEADIDSTKVKLVKRETLIDIVKGSSITAQVRMRYYYQVQDYPYFDNALDPTSTADVDFPIGGGNYAVDVIMDSPAGTYIEFYNNPEEAGLERIFVYYYPAYKNKLDTDIIKFTTSGFSSSEKLECYLLKQVNTGMGTGELRFEEARYEPQVSGTANLILYHNFDENISGGSSVRTISPSGFSSSKSYTDANLIKEDRMLMYHVTVNLYEEGGTEIVASLEGTMND